MIRVAIVDDHPIVRDGIAATFADQPDIAVVATADSATAALEAIARSRADVAVVDLELPGAEDVSLVARLCAVEPAPRVVVFSAFSSEERVRRALEAGATSFVRKGTPSQELVDVVRAAAAGEARLPADVAAQLVRAMRAPSATRITSRQLQIVRLVARGLTNRAIAHELAISERTVKFHLGELFARLGAGNRAQAVDLARERDLL